MENNIEEEIWRDIPGYEGYYQVSNFGRVKSLGRIFLRGGKHPCVRKTSFLKPTLNNKGYCQNGLYKDGKMKVFRVHQLVAVAFLNYKLNGVQEIVCDHINNVKTDNSLCNLQLITQRENSSKNKKGSSKYIGVTWDKGEKSGQQ